MTDPTTSPSDAPVLFEEVATASGHRFGRITLNAPASLNALSLEMVDLIDARLRAWARGSTVVGIIIDAVGDKAFCAGGDVVGLYRSIRSAEPGQVPVGAATFFEREYRLDYRIHCYPKPVLAWCQGIVMGGGIGLMAGASHRVLTPTTKLAMPEVGIGLYPDVGGSWILPRMPGGSGLFLALTGATINAADACFGGLGDFVLNHDDLGPVLKAVAAGSWSGDAAQDAASLSHLLDGFAAGVERPASPLRSHFDRIATVVGHDGLKDLAPRLAALADDTDPWLARAGKAFLASSPMAVALGFELQRRVRHLSLADIFRLEWQASIGCCVHSDFAEGVRALLVDKDRQPRWQPASLADVTPALIEAHLAPRFEGAHPLADLA